MGNEDLVAYYITHDGFAPMSWELALRNVIWGYFGKITGACEADNWVSFTIPLKTVDDCIARLEKYNFKVTQGTPTCVRCK